MEMGTETELQILRILDSIETVAKRANRTSTDILAKVIERGIAEGLIKAQKYRDSDKYVRDPT